MRLSSLLSLLLLLGACQNAPQPAVDRGHAEAGKPTSDVPPGGVEPANPGALTPPADGGEAASIAQAAQVQAAQAQGAPDAGPEVVEDGPCQRDQDCALTNVPKGGCCALLCAGRAVTKERAAQLAADEALCAQKIGGPCPAPLCRPPRARRVAACAQGRCTVRTEAVPDPRQQ